MRALQKGGSVGDHWSSPSKPIVSKRIQVRGAGLHFSVCFKYLHEKYDHVNACFPLLSAKL